MISILKYINIKTILKSILAVLLVSVGVYAFTVPSGTITQTPATTFFADSTMPDQGAATSQGNKSIKDFVDSNGATKKATIYLAHKGAGNTTTYTVSTDETIPSNINVMAENGAKLSPDVGITLAIGRFSAGSYETFIGAGTVTVSKYPQDQAWWGNAQRFETTDLTVDTYTVSGFIKTLIDDADAATARATLGAPSAAGLGTGDSPTFVTTKLSGLTDGYIPYHVADATGLADSVIFTDGTNVGIGVADPDTLLELYKVGTQLKLSGGAADYATFAVAADGALTITTVDVDAAAANINLAPDGDVVVSAGDFDVNTHDASSIGLKLGGTLVTASAAELNLLDGVTAFLDEDNMASDSPTSLASQQSIKAYADAIAGAVGGVSAAGNFGTDNVMIRSDGVVKVVQHTGIAIDNSDNVSGMGTLACGAITTTGNLALAANSITGTSVDINNAELQLLSSITAAGGALIDDVNAAAQATTLGLGTGDSPTHVTTKLTGLTDGYIPYHVADATGLANSPIFTDGTDVGIGTASPGAKLDILDGRLYLSDSDVVHGMTNYAAANAYGRLLPYSATVGGLVVGGFTDTTDTTPALLLQGFLGSADPTDTTPAVILMGGKQNGVNTQALAASETALKIRNYTTDLVTALGSGNIGIGTATPTSLLHVEQDQADMTANVPLVNLSTIGTAAITKGAILHLSSTRGTGTDDTDLFKVSGATGTWFTVRNSGDIGIGSTTFSARQWGHLGNSKVFNVAHYGAVGDGSTVDTTAINNAIAALNTAGRGVLYFPATSSYYKVNTAALTTITVPCIIEGDGNRSQVKQTTANKGLFYIYAATDIIVRNIRLTGQSSTYFVNVPLLHIVGASAAAPTKWVKIENVVMHTAQSHGIKLQFVDFFEISGCNIYDLAFVGITASSCEHGRIHHNYIDGVDVGDALAASYGIMLTTASGDFEVNPVCEWITVDHNIVKNVLNWEGIDTHGGKNITIDHNQVYNSYVGILTGRGKAYITGTNDTNHLTICTDTEARTMADLGAYIGAGVTNDTDGSSGTISAVSTDTFTAALGGGSDNSWDVDDAYTIIAYSPIKNVMISNNLVYSDVAAVTAAGIKLHHQDAYHYATGSIIGNMIVGHAYQASDNYGAIQIDYTKSVNIQGNTIIEPSPCGITVRNGNKDFSVIGNTIIDPWATADIKVTGIVVTDGGNNTGFIDGNHIARDDKSATYTIDGANGYAIYEENAGTNDVSLGTYRSEANTDIFNGGQITSADFGI